MKNNTGVAPGFYNHPKFKDVFIEVIDGWASPNEPSIELTIRYWNKGYDETNPWIITNPEPLIISLSKWSEFIPYNPKTKEEKCQK